MSELWGVEVAAAYDDADDPMNDQATIGRTVDRLSDLADGGPIIEFAVGTGRIARPRSESRLEVAGIDNSITNLLSQADQVACFRNGARHSATGGSFRDRGVRPAASASTSTT